MQTPENNNSLMQKIKKMKINRTGVLTVLVLLVALTIIISVTIASNRSKKPATDGTTPPKDSVTTAPDAPTDTTTPPETNAPTTNPPSDTGNAPVENKVPSLILPVSGVLSQKHDPTLQVFSNTMNDYRVHIGVDIGTEENAPVYAAADGTVSKVWEDPLMGHCIAISHSGNCMTVYKNLAKELPDGIAEGSKVRSGQLIASVGDSAMIEIAEEPHLHFEVTMNNLSVNPLEYFDEKALESLSIDASHGE